MRLIFTPRHHWLMPERSWCNEEEISINLITDELVVVKKALGNKTGWAFARLEASYCLWSKFISDMCRHKIRDTAETRVRPRHGYQDTSTSYRPHRHPHRDTTTLYKQCTQKLPIRVFRCRYRKWNQAVVEKRWLSCRGHVRFLP